MSSIRCLRPELPPPGNFTIAEVPHRAKLDQNEAAVDLPAALKAELAAEVAAAPWHRYPQPAEYRAAKAKLAAAIGQPPETVALTVGADQVIQAAFLLAGGPGRRARWFEPTYPFVPLMSRVTGTIGEGIVLGADMDARIDAAAVLAAPAPQLAVFVRPNNPTGGMVAREAVIAALADDERLVFVDEAYADFSDETVAPLVATHTNLLVGRSLSKSLLAAVRVGFTIGHPEAIDTLERIYTAPYHLNALQLVVAARYGDLLPHVRAAAAATVAERERVYTALVALPGLTPQPSRGNFVLFGVDGDGARAEQLHAALLSAGVRLRNASRLPGLGAHLRVTIGTPAENDLFLTTLAAALATPRTSPQRI